MNDDLSHCIFSSISDKISVLVKKGVVDIVLFSSIVVFLPVLHLLLLMGQT